MKTPGLIALLAVGILAVSCANSNVDSQTDVQIRSEQTSAAPREISSDGGWQDLVTDVAGGIFLGAEKGIIFYAYDVLTYPDEPVELAAKVQMARILEDVPDVTVGFYQDSKLIGSAKTDDYGRASLRWTPPKAADYFFTAKIIAVPDKDYEDMLEVSPAPLLVAARTKETLFVVIDLDHTVVGSSFFRVLLGGAKPMTNSVEVTRRIGKKYSIIYLTQRPALLTRKSKLWLKDNRYPAGALLLSDLKEALSGSGKFKTNRLAVTKKSFPGIQLGIGDKPSDAQAYVDNGMTAYLLPHYKEKSKDLMEKARQIRDLRGQGRLHVVGNWSEIEAGILKRRTFPPETFVSHLECRATQLQIEENRRKEKEEEEEDDDDEEEEDDDDD